MVVPDRTTDGKKIGSSSVFHHPPRNGRAASRAGRHASEANYDFGLAPPLESEKFEDHYETALVDLINQKRAGKPIRPKERPRTSWREAAQYHRTDEYVRQNEASRSILP